MEIDDQHFPHGDVRMQVSCYSKCIANVKAPPDPTVLLGSKDLNKIGPWSTVGMVMNIELLYIINHHSTYLYIILIY